MENLSDGNAFFSLDVQKSHSSLPAFQISGHGPCDALAAASPVLQSTGLVWEREFRSLPRAGLPERAGLEYGRQVTLNAKILVHYRYDQYRLPAFITRQIRRIFPAPEYKKAHVRSIGDGVDLVVISLGDNWGLADGLAWLEAARFSGQKYVVISSTVLVAGRQRCGEGGGML
jgi:hypothetical protein